MKQELKLPVVVCADDYHEFDYIKTVLRRFGCRNIDFVEIPGELDESAPYNAVFFAGSKKSNANRRFFKKLKKELLDSYKEAFGVEYEGDLF